MIQQTFFMKQFKLNLLNSSIRWAFSAVFIFFSQNTKACGFDYVTDCSTFSRFSVNGLETEYFNSYCTYRAAFPTSLGSNITELKLTDGSTYTWESCTNQVIKSAILYRIYNNPSNKGSFLRVDLTQNSIHTDGEYRDRVYSKAASNSFLANLLTNLQSSTNYTIEMYFEIGVDSDGNGIVDATGVRDNAGNYYAATFQTGNIGTVLPVAFLNFQAQAKNQSVFLNWQTATEKDNTGFQIERSVEGKVFKNIGEVKGFGTSNEKQIYTFTDADPLSIIGYYRLCQVDMGGNKTYSKTLAVSFESKNTLTLFPNPATNQITLQVDKAVDVTITVFDRMGRMVLQTKSTDSRMDLDISHLQAGTYWARVTTPKESLQRAFVKQ